MPRVPRFTPGIPCWSNPCSSLEKRPGSSRGSLRRHLKGAISMYAFSASAMLPGVEPELLPRVLIADDEESMRTLVARAIAMDDHQTVTAQDGAEALEILTREEGAFDLLLTDIQMPIMDGIALAL